MGYKIFVINPGSTSTKLAYFDDETKLFETNVFHDAPELLKFKEIKDQFGYRMDVIERFLADNNIDLTGVDAIVGRGGSSYSVEGGVYAVTDRLIEDTMNAVGGIKHPCNLGCALANALCRKYGGVALMVESPNTDEYQDVARLTGIKGVHRASAIHALNHKGTVRLHCRRVGVRYEDGNYIVCHIDGGISIAAHCRGKMIDATTAGQGEGPFTPTRIGSLPVNTVIKVIEEQGMDALRDYVIRTGGLVSYFGTSNSDKVHALVEQGDPKASLVWEAIGYNICKAIGSMAAVLGGKVDGIVLGGGLLRFADLVQQIRDNCEWIAPVYAYPGEVEHETMAEGALRVLRGEETPQVYSGRPVWDGFAWEE
ncbi:MAG: butyrate kinase [Mogibacterium sp.]|nr:butyrate kinase [Mogibacterium sp.]